MIRGTRGLDETISQIFEELEVREQDNRLTLHSDYLQDIISRPFRFFDFPIIGDLANIVQISYITYIKIPRIKNKLSDGIENYLVDKVETEGEDQEKYASLLEAFRTAHDIDINGFKVNYKDATRPNFFVRNLDWFVYGGLIASIALSTIPGNLENFGWGMYLAAGVYAYTRTKKGNVRNLIDVPAPDIEEIKEDITKLTENYNKHYGKHDKLTERSETVYMREEFIANIETSLEDPDISEEKTAMLNRVLEGSREAPDEKTITVEVIQENLPSFSKLKEYTDEFLQKYCPCKNLGDIDVEIANLSLGTLGSHIKPNKIKISKFEVEQDLRKFPVIYAHEAAHADGIGLEGMCQYTAIKVLKEIIKDRPEEGFEEFYYDNLLDGAVHTYLVERVKAETNGKGRLAKVRDFFRKKNTSNGDGIYDNVKKELMEIGVPDRVAWDVLSRENSGALFYGAQALFKGDTFRGGYTVDLYKIMKSKGEELIL